MYDPSPPEKSRVTIGKRLLTGTVPVNNSLLTGTVPVNNFLLTGTLVWYLLLFFHIEIGLFAKNKWPLVASVFKFEPSKPSIFTRLTSSHLELKCMEETGSDQEAVLSAHITFMERPLFWNFPVTSNKTFLWTNMDALNNFRVEFKTLECHVQLKSKLDLFFSEVSCFIKFRTTSTLFSGMFWLGCYSCSCCDGNRIKSTPCSQTWTRTRTKQQFFLIFPYP